MAGTNRVTRGLERTLDSFWGFMSVAGVVLLLLWWWLPGLPNGTGVLVFVLLMTVRLWLYMREGKRSTVPGKNPERRHPLEAELGSVDAWWRPAGKNLERRHPLEE